MIVIGLLPTENVMIPIRSGKRVTYRIQTRLTGTYLVIGDS